MDKALKKYEEKRPRGLWKKQILDYDGRVYYIFISQCLGLGHNLEMTTGGYVCKTCGEFILYATEGA